MKICDFEITDKLYESQNSIIYRTKAHEGRPKVILKVLKENYPVPEELVRFHQELEITQLFSSSNIIKVYGIEKYGNTLVLLVEEFGGDSLSSWLKRKPPSLLESLKLSVEICQGLADIHAGAVIHKDISPSNIIWNPESSEVKIIDFGISSRLERSLAFPAPPTFLEGNLFYMSPEQTGRMNRHVDYRSDFYSLGVTLYELFSGKKPFETDDALEIIHSHIAKEPLSPEKINSLLPTVLAEIILKCLSKSADDRYQSAEGIKADLMECLRQFESSGDVKPFELARNDFSSRFRLPTKLYGRDGDAALLTNAFEKVCAGETIFTLVNGYSGVGKSSLVQELYRPLAIAKGRYTSGKYDQYQRNIPYSALARALDSLCLQLLGESTKLLNDWRQKIIDTVGRSGQVLIEVIPALEKIIGPQPTVAPVDPQAAQNRFNQLFQDFAEAICRPEEPLVLFLDDLQWADSASLALLKTIAKNQRLRGLHLVGAYRDNEVDSSHPLSLMLGELEKEGRATSTIHLENLSYDDVVTLISDTLHLPKANVSDLAAMIHSKTEGNAFFATEFIKALYSEGLLKFSHDRHRWAWDIDQIQARQITDNVVDLMASRIEMLPESCKRMLKLAACVGNQFDLSTLAIISETNHDLVLTREHLMPAIHLGILIPQGENYRRIGISDVDAQGVIFKFQHDRVQQAAYSLISEEEKPKAHLHIGKVLLNSCQDSEAVEKRIFDIVAHFNKGRALILAQKQKNQVARLNFQAGMKARKASAHRASFEYFSVSKELLPQDAFHSEYQLALEVHLNLAKSCYVTGRFDEAEKLYPIVLQHARSTMDKVQLHLVQMNDYHLQGDYERAIGVQTQALRLLGANVPVADADWTPAIESELDNVPTNLGPRSTSDLVNAPELESEEILAHLKLLVGMWMSAYLVSKENIVQWSSVRMANLCLRHGNSELAAFAFVQYGYVCIARRQQFEMGYEYGKVALKLSDRYDNAEVRGKVYFMFGLVINHWTKHVSLSTESFRKGYLYSVEAGDWTYAVYGAANIISNLLIAGTPCDEVYAEASKYFEFIKDKAVVGLNSFFLPGAFCALLNLQGKTRNRETFNCEYLDEEGHLKTLGRLPIVEAWFYAVKIRSLYLFRCFARGVEAIPKAEMVATGVPGQVKIPEAYFYSCLMFAATNHSIIDAKTKSDYWGLFEKYRAQMKLWADHCPENFLHKHYLIEAEKYRLDSASSDEIIVWYDKAITAAREDGFPNNEALSHELKARFYLEKGRKEEAFIELKEALYRYRLWGATGKVRMLEEEFPELSPKFLRESFATFQGTGILSSAYLDLLTAHKAARAISGEIDLDKLIQTMMKIVIESAGAQRGILILEQSDRWFIEAEANMGDKDVEVKSRLNLGLEPKRGERAKLPSSIINYVLRTRTAVTLNDATHDRRFGNDAYVAAFKPKSVFCMPLVLQGRTTGLIYLENNCSADVFSPKRQEILGLLATQISISLENAHLFASQKAIVSRQHQTLAELEARERELRESKEQLKKHMADLARSNTELEQFAYVASHDLRSPLKSIVNWVQMLDYLVPKPRTVELDQAIQFIESNAQKATILIDDVMEMARVNVSTAPVSRVDLNVVVRGVLNNLEEAIQTTQAKVRSDTLPTVDGIPTYLESIFKNLIQNALTYRVKSRIPEIQIGFKEQIDFYEFFVKDNGIGVAPQDYNRIFQMFTRLYNEKEYPAGSGIGLALSKKIVELFGGRMWVSSIPGEGSTFFFTHPQKWGGNKK